MQEHASELFGVCLRDNGAHLAAIRRDALEAILRSFLASWNGYLGADLDTTPLLKLERVVEWLAANDLKTCKVIIASTSSSFMSKKLAVETDPKSKHRRRNLSFAESTELFEMSCIRANFPALPDHDGIFAAPFRVIELEKPTDKKFDGLVQLPSKTKSTTGNGSAPLSPLESKALSRLDSGWHGEIDARIPTPLAKQASPIAEDFSDSERDWQDVTGEHLLSEMNDDDEVKMSTWYKCSVIAIKVKLTIGVHFGNFATSAAIDMVTSKRRRESSLFRVAEKHGRGRYAGIISTPHRESKL